MSELYERREGRLLTRAAYAAIGGVGGALARSAEAAYGALAAEARPAARLLFLRLVAPGDGADDARRRARRAELSAPALAVAERFAAARLLTLDREPASRAPTVEVAHEALLREWPRLRGWLDGARDDLRLQRRLALEAAEWERAGREPDFLAGGARLAQYEALAEGSSVELTPAERGFVEASRDERVRQAAAEGQRQARELAQARAAAEAQRSAAGRLRLLVGALALFLLAAAGLSALALGQQREAEGQRALAEEQARLARVRAWSAAALNSLESDPERSLLLSLRAVTTTHELDGNALPEAEDALRRALQAAKLKRRLEVDGAAFVMGVWSPDGQRIAVQSHTRDGAKLLNLWDRGLTTKTFTVTTDTVGSWAAFSPDGRLLAAHTELFETGGDEAQPIPRELTTHVYDLATGEVRHALPLLIPQFSADGAQVTGFSSAGLAGGNDRIATYDVATGRLAHAIELPIPIAETRFSWLSPDGTRCAEVLTSDELVVFDTRTGVEMYRLADEIDSVVVALRFSADGRHLAVGRNNGLIELYATEDEGAVRRAQTLVGGEADIYALAFSADNARLAAASDRTITVWQVNTGRRQLVLPGHSARVTHLAFSPDGGELFSSDEAGSVRIWDVLPARERAAYVPAAYEFALSPSRTRLIGTGIDERARLWDVSGRQAPLELVGHEATVWGAEWSADERVVATGAEDGSVRLWDAATGLLRAELVGHTREVFDFDFSPDGGQVLSGGADMSARIWDVQTGEELLRLDHEQAVNRVLFSRDGRRLYAGLSQTGEIRVYDSDSGALLATWAQHRSSIFDMALSPDGKRLATASRDGEARIWDAASGEALLVLRGHAGDVRDLDYSPDGAWLATASFDATVRIWDARSGAHLRSIPTGEGAVQVAFTADGAGLIVSTTAGSATVFTLDLEELIALGEARLTRGWAPEECRQYLQLEQCE